jgi:broad specificity phosphatase PhoE
MRWLEVRRHSLTKKGSARGRGSHLSAEGVALARLVGGSLGPFAVVVTSASPRALETAVAMGFAVDDTVELPSGYVSGEVDHHGQWRWPHPYRSYAELIGRGGGLASVAETHRRIWTSVVAAVPDGAATLVVGHGGGIEPGLVACLPNAGHERWGGPFGPCDGARLAFDGGRFVSVQFRRAPAELLPGGAQADGR